MQPKSYSLPELPRICLPQEPQKLRHKLIRRETQAISPSAKTSFTSYLRYLVRPQIIGKGRYSTVKLAMDMRTMKTLVAKFVEVPKFLDVFKQEVEALGRLNHPNIVTLYHYEIWNGKGILYLEQLSKITLTDYLDEMELLSEEKSLNILNQLVTAVKHVHRRCITHNDIKPDNVAYDPKTGNIKLFDFGLATVVDPNNPNINFHGGSPLYMAPELLHETHNPFFSDIWSIGIILYEMLIGEAPLTHCTDLQDLVIQLRNGSSHFYYPNTLSLFTKNLIAMMLHDNPGSRISLVEIQDLVKRTG